jgi:hypothetical protein
VSGNVVVTSTVVGAVTTGSACAALATAAGGWGLVDCGGVVDAFAPDRSAVTCVVEPVAGLETRTVVGDETFGLVATDAAPDEAGGFACRVVGAVTWGWLGVVAFTGEGGTCAPAGGAAIPLMRKSVRANEPIARRIGWRCMQHLR